MTDASWQTRTYHTDASKGISRIADLAVLPRPQDPDQLVLVEHLVSIPRTTLGNSFRDHDMAPEELGTGRWGRD